jgi:hypothetical protein
VPQVDVPSRYRGPTNGRCRIDVDGEKLIFDSRGGQRRFVRLFVNGDEIPRDAADTPVAEDDCVQILAAAAGG